MQSKNQSGGRHHNDWPDWSEGPAHLLMVTEVWHYSMQWRRCKYLCRPLWPLKQNTMMILWLHKTDCYFTVILYHGKFIQLLAKDSSGKEIKITMPLMNKFTILLQNKHESANDIKFSCHIIINNYISKLEESSVLSKLLKNRPLLASFTSFFSYTYKRVTVVRSLDKWFADVGI